MNAPGELSPKQERQLRECYATLHELADSCDVPSVAAAARVAVAELHAALDGQALDFEFYSHRWSGEREIPLREAS
ncbi:DUF6052 family protein [Microbispora sp. H13382]|nr:DUF6052 family protein [Microbispora sp. H13382]